MKAIASGRASEIFDLGGGRVLRRGGNARGGLRSHAALLADLHKRLHEIDALDGGRQLHMDLHPENVILSKNGAVVVDWTNARGGESALDVAMTWVIGATSAGVPGRLFLRSFLPHFDLAEVRLTLLAAGGLRLRDPNVTGREKRAVQRLTAPG